MAAHPRVADDRGKVAVMRGPVVYCLEGDNVPEGVALERVFVPATAGLKPVFSNELGRGTVVVAPNVSLHGASPWHPTHRTIKSNSLRRSPERLLGANDRKRP